LFRRFMEILKFYFIDKMQVYQLYAEPRRIKFHETSGITWGFQ